MVNCQIDPRDVKYKYCNYGSNKLTPYHVLIVKFLHASYLNSEI